MRKEDAPSRPSGFGRLLREWRAKRGKSQLDLALAAGVSSRHLSFIETGRATPSRAMILSLADALDVPLRDRNGLLQASGFAALYRETSFEDPEMEFVRTTLDALLGATRYPSFVVDRAYDLVTANDAARRLVLAFTGKAVPQLPRPNVLRIGLSKQWMRPYVDNLEQIAPVIFARARREWTGAAAPLGLDDVLTELLLDDEIARAIRRSDSTDRPSVVLPVRLKKGDLTLSLFSIISTLGTPQDITLQELRIESLFPADATSAASLDAMLSAR